MTRPATRSGRTSPLSRVFGLFPGRDYDPRFQHAFEQLPAGFMVHQRSRAILAINGNAAVLTEWTRGELASHYLLDILAVPPEGEVVAYFDLMQPGSHRVHWAVPLRTRSGQVILVDLRLTAFTENDEVVVLILAAPISERLGQEKAAAQQTRALHKLAQLLALFGAATEETLADAVRLIREMLGASAVGLYRVAPSAPGFRLQCAEGLPATFPVVIGPSEVGYLMKPLQWTSGQRAESFLQRLVRAAGWASFFSHPIGSLQEVSPQEMAGTLFAGYSPGSQPPPQAAALIAMAAQLIDHLVAKMVRESNLADSQTLALRLSSQLAAINAQIEEGAVVINSEGLIDAINGAAAQMLGYRSEDIIGLPLGDVLVFDDFLAETVRHALGGSILLAREGKLHRRSGEPFPVLVRLRPLPDCGAVLTLRDLSEQRANELRQEYLDHLSYVGQSTQSFAHDVRAPLNNISMGVQYLATKLPPDDAIQQHLSKIQAECQRLSDMMTDLLAWAKPLDPKLELFELGALLQRLVARWKSRIKQQNVRVNVSIIEDCPPVLADLRLIEHVFVNLIENALQAMPTGGHLSVALRTVDRGPQGRFIEARVGDSGPGISEDVHRRIFDPYFTTKPGGTGLGLAICKRLVTIHHGGIDVESFAGMGTIFVVTLPVYDPDQMTTST